MKGRVSQETYLASAVRCAEYAERHTEELGQNARRALERLAWEFMKRGIEAGTSKPRTEDCSGDRERAPPRVSVDEVRKPSPLAIDVISPEHVLQPGIVIVEPQQTRGKRVGPAVEHHADEAEDAHVTSISQDDRRAG